MRKIFIILLLTTTLMGCSKKEEEEQIETTSDPEIKFIALYPVVVVEYKNSITLRISYKDINGDLGYSDPDKYALWVKDERLDSSDFYHVPPLAPPGVEIPIQGSLDIVLNSMFIIGNGEKELTTLYVKLKDRAGHWSNVIRTPPITIKKS